MAEPTNPETGVTQAPPSVEERMANFLTQYDEDQKTPPPDPEQTEEVAAAEPDGQAEELSLEDIEATPQPQSVDEFEIVHNGTQRKLNREETIRLAQQGFDYTQKTQALAETQKQVQERMRAVQEMEQVQPLLAQDLAQVTAIEAQLKPYQNVDWVRLATDNPLEYPKWRAQYDTLVNGYQAAVGQFQQKRQFISQRQAALTAQTVQQEAVKLRERIPAFKDEATFEKAASDIRAYLVKEGLPAEAVDRLNDSLSVSVAYKAMLYDRLVQAKADKSKQLKPLPPVTRPGASQASQPNDKRQKLVDRFKRTGNDADAAALLLERMK